LCFVTKAKLAEEARGIEGKVDRRGGEEEKLVRQPREVTPLRKKHRVTYMSTTCHAPRSDMSKTHVPLSGAEPERLFFPPLDSFAGGECNMQMGMQDHVNRTKTKETR